MPVKNNETINKIKRSNFIKIIFIAYVTSAAFFCKL